VKVRCKKCGNVIVVRRAGEPAPAPTIAPAASAASGANGAAPPGGLDAELGHAFDSVFGEPPAAPPGRDPGETQAMGAEDAARIAAAPAAAPVPPPAETEWYVAIGQAQVGPLPLVEVKRKWEGGDVGPDSLVWRPGMGDWQPLTAVAELAGYLAPVPRAPKAARDAQPSRGEPQPARERASDAAAPAPGEEVSWKPVGASALAALASEEIAARAAPEPRPAPRPAGAAGGAKSLMDGLPDGGGVDPTGALPLSIKGLETTGEKKIERRSTIASRAEEARHKRSITRLVAIAAVVVVAAVGGAAAWVVTQTQKLAPPPPAPVAAAPAAPASPPPAASVPASAAPAAEPAPAQPAVAAPAEPPPVAAPPPPAEQAPPKAAPPPRRVAKAEPPPRREAPRREATPARAAAPAPDPTPAPPPAPARKKYSLLDFDSNDSALDEALGGSPSGRSVYVPPARAAAPPLPDKLTPAQINESVAGRIDALRKCVSDQKGRDPDASGVLKLRWVIGADGNVRDVKTLTTEYASSPFSQCITGVVKSIRFPRSATTGQEVTFPFSF
jgi:hypothetical protein